MQRPQKTAKVGCPCEGMLETESNKGVCSVARLETERQDGAENLLEAILDRNNLNKEYLKVKGNGVRQEQTECEDIVDTEEPISEQQDELTEELENASFDQNADKQRKVVIRTERPPQEVQENE